MMRADNDDVIKVAYKGVPRENKRDHVDDQRNAGQM